MYYFILLRYYIINVLSHIIIKVLSRVIIKVLSYIIVLYHIINEVSFIIILPTSS